MGMQMPSFLALRRCSKEFRLVCDNLIIHLSPSAAAGQLASVAMGQYLHTFTHTHASPLSPCMQRTHMDWVAATSPAIKLTCFWHMAHFKGKYLTECTTKPMWVAWHILIQPCHAASIGNLSCYHSMWHFCIKTHYWKFDQWFYLELLGSLLPITLL